MTTMPTITDIQLAKTMQSFGEVHDDLVAALAKYQAINPDSTATDAEVELFCSLENAISDAANCWAIAVERWMLNPDK